MDLRCWWSSLYLLVAVAVPTALRQRNTHLRLRPSRHRHTSALDRCTARRDRLHLRRKQCLLATPRLLGKQTLRDSSKRGLCPFPWKTVLCLCQRTCDHLSSSAKQKRAEGVRGDAELSMLLRSCRSLVRYRCWPGSSCARSCQDLLSQATCLHDVLR